MSKHPPIRAAKKPSKSITLSAVPVEIAAEMKVDGAVKPRRFSMNAYNGGPMNLNGYYTPVVIDLSGISGTDKTRPVLKNHDDEQLVGHADRITVTGGVNGAINAEGVVSGGGDAAREVLTAHDNGYPWQASIGAYVQNFEFVKAGSEVTVNGRTLKGPLNVARKTVLGEISFVPLGADDSTSARIAAEAAKDSAMNFEQWLEARGFTLDGLSDKQKGHLQAQFDAEQKKPGEGEGDPAPAPAKPKKGGKKVAAAARKPKAEEGEGDDDGQDDDPAQVLRASGAGEMKRQAALSKIAAKYRKTMDPEAVATLQAKAIEEDWTEEHMELEALRAERPKAPAAIIRDATVTGAVLEAAACLTGGLETVYASRGGSVSELAIDKAFKPEVLEAADKRFSHGIGLQEMILEAAWANGYQGASFRRDPSGVLRAAFAPIQATGFSTFSLPGILSNVANKFLLQGFMGVDASWRQIANSRPVTDFKSYTSFRLTGDGQFEEVGADGEIKHGQLASESYTNRAKTYAKMFAITRQDLINDDLGALTAVPKRLGRGSSLKLNDVFWTAFVDAAAAFYTTGNGNVISGAGSALSLAGLSAANQKFLDQVDADGKPLSITPKVLLVPTALKITAETLTRSIEIRDTTANTKYPTSNPWAGMFTVITTPYLGNSHYGNSSTAWYLIGSPDDIPVVEIAFLNGRQEPVVETADADFNNLGIQLRGYFDFGVTLQDPRAIVKSVGV